MEISEIEATLAEIAGRIEQQAAHACAGWDCAVCQPSKNAEQLRQVLAGFHAGIADHVSEELRELEERGPITY